MIEPAEQSATTTLDPEHEEHKPGWLQRHDVLNQPGVPMPGPWEWEIHDASMATLCGGGEDAITGHIMAIGPCKSCYTDKEDWEWGRCGTPSIENARLISAAPDLLAALDSLLRAHDGIYRSDSAAALARDAIAKATGTT